MKYCPHCAYPLAPRSINGLERIACSRCSFIHWGNPVPAVAGVVEYNGKILLVRNAKWPAGSFSLVTGYLERDETPEQGIVREIQEELGLDASIRGFIGHYSFFAMNALILAFHLEAEGTLELNDEIAEVTEVRADLVYRQNFPDAPFAAQVVRDWYQQQNWRRVA
ncbi:MAG: NUDIX domain-containing protein [Thiofilum sp.]|uniref:NUDIX domain-containing protein n=1 Tax=Thiofilum sp. TaxID=2212733 RepID=UPI0025CE6964|nr:NUDIX domain-containing protein [Thiofilum sp.]MBK8452795.1 NUDIX hydrolase [Thiofilum sp.]